MELTHRIKTLEKDLVNLPADSTDRIDVMLWLAMELWTTDTERAQALTDEGKALAIKHNYDKGIAWSKLNNAVNSWQDSIQSALPSILEALDWFTANNDPHGEAYCRGFLGLIYWSFGDFESGFEMVYKALELARQNEDYLDGLGWSHQMLGGFYYDSGDMEQALEHFEKCREVFEKAKNNLGITRALNGIGNIHIARGEFEEAEKVQEECLALARSTAHQFTESRVLNDLGQLYSAKGDMEKSLEFHRQSLALRNELKYPAGQTTTLMDIGDILLNSGDLEEAEKHFQEALELSNKILAKPKMSRAHTGLAAVYEKKNLPEKALYHVRQLYQIEKDIFYQDSNQKLKNLRAVYEAEANSREAEIHRLRNVELKEKNEALLSTLNQLNTTQAQLVQSSKMAALGNLVAGVMHEINSPIGALKSNLDLFGRLTERLEKTVSQINLTAELNLAMEKVVKLLKQNQVGSIIPLKRIDDILKSFKGFVHLDEATLIQSDLKTEIEHTLVLASHKLKDGPEVQTEFDSDVPPLYLQASEINQVFMNLILNAAQATPKTGKISIRTENKEHSVLIHIADTGKGMPQEMLETLFEPGFVKDKERVRMRTGLFSSYQTIQKHGGDLTVKSIQGEGSTFTISLPKKNPQAESA